MRQIAAAAGAAGRPARLHLKADTGLSRGGATPEQWPAVIDAALTAQADGLVEVTGLWSHFACADEPGHPSIQAQLIRFAEATALAEKAGAEPEVRHIANTAAAITVPDSRLDLVRLGGAIYGLSTLPGGAPGWLRPAMTLKARLAQVKRVPPGTGVSYGHRYVTTEPATLGLVPLGYADGVPRAAIGQPLVQVRGRRWPIAGRSAWTSSWSTSGPSRSSRGTRWCCSARVTGARPPRRSGEKRWARSPTRSSPESAAGCRGPTRVSHPMPEQTIETIEVPTAGAMQDLGRRLAAGLRAGDLLVLTGPLGAGKTTLVQGIGEGLGVRGPITSPTFVIARVHPSLTGGPALVHADAYRLGGAAEIDDLDLDSSTASSVTVVEWGEGLAEGLSEDRLEIAIELHGEGRVVRLTAIGPRWAADRPPGPGSLP